MLIWDGDCGFCKFWVIRWKARTRDKIQYETFQNSASKFPDIPLKEFKKASRLIEMDGSMYSGPDSAYKCLWHAGTKSYHQLYVSNKFFQKVSDKLYNHIAKNRKFYFKITKLLFGSDPKNLKPFWLLYIFIIFILILFI